MISSGGHLETDSETAVAAPEGRTLEGVEVDQLAVVGDLLALLDVAAQEAAQDAVGDPLVDGVGQSVALVQQQVQVVRVELVALVDLAASYFRVSAQSPQHVGHAWVGL
jgi:hypothetical protein